MEIERDPLKIAIAARLKAVKAAGDSAYEEPKEGVDLSSDPGIDEAEDIGREEKSRIGLIDPMLERTVDPRIIEDLGLEGKGYSIVKDMSPEDREMYLAALREESAPQMPAVKHPDYTYEPVVKDRPPMIPSTIDVDSWVEKGLYAKPPDVLREYLERAHEKQFGRTPEAKPYLPFEDMKAIYNAGLEAIEKQLASGDDSKAHIHSQIEGIYLPWVEREEKSAEARDIADARARGEGARDGYWEGEEGKLPLKFFSDPSKEDVLSGKAPMSSGQLFEIYEMLNRRALAARDSDVRDYSSQIIPYYGDLKTKEQEISEENLQRIEYFGGDLKEFWKWSTKKFVNNAQERAEQLRELGEYTNEWLRNKIEEQKKEQISNLKKIAEAAIRAETMSRNQATEWIQAKLAEWNDWYVVPLLRSTREEAQEIANEASLYNSNWAYLIKQAYYGNNAALQQLFKDQIGQDFNEKAMDAFGRQPKEIESKWGKKGPRPPEFEYMDKSSPMWKYEGPSAKAYGSESISGVFPAKAAWNLYYVDLNDYKKAVHQMASDQNAVILSPTSSVDVVHHGIKEKVDPDLRQFIPTEVGKYAPTEKLMGYEQGSSFPETPYGVGMSNALSVDPGQNVLSAGLNSISVMKHPHELSMGGMSYLEYVAKRAEELSNAVPLEALFRRMFKLPHTDEELRSIVEASYPEFEQSVFNALEDERILLDAAGGSGSLPGVGGEEDIPVTGEMLGQAAERIAPLAVYTEYLSSKFPDIFEGLNKEVQDFLRDSSGVYDVSRAIKTREVGSPPKPTQLGGEYGAPGEGTETAFKELEESRKEKAEERETKIRQERPDVMEARENIEEAMDYAGDLMDSIDTSDIATKMTHLLTRVNEALESRIDTSTPQGRSEFSQKLRKVMDQQVYPRIYDMFPDLAQYVEIYDQIEGYRKALGSVGEEYKDEREKYVGEWKERSDVGIGLMQEREEREKRLMEQGFEDLSERKKRMEDAAKTRSKDVERGDIAIERSPKLTEDDEMVREVEVSARLPKPRELAAEIVDKMKQIADSDPMVELTEQMIPSADSLVARMRQVYKAVEKKRSRKV